MLKRVLGLIGLVLIVAGIVMAVRPVRVLGVDCGSVLQPTAGITPMQCDARIADRGKLALALGLAGLATATTTLAASALSSRRTNPARRSS